MNSDFSGWLPWFVPTTEPVTASSKTAAETYIFMKNVVADALMTLVSIDILDLVDILVQMVLADLGISVPINTKALFSMK